MESMGQLVRLLAWNTFWLTASGVVLWVWIRVRPRRSPRTLALSSILVVLQGWVWFGIPIQVDREHEILHRPVSTAGEMKAASEIPSVAEAILFNQVHSIQQTASSRDSLDFAVLTWCTVGVWLSGMAIIVARSLRAAVKLSRLVGELPDAPRAWQDELVQLCRRSSNSTRVALRIGDVATPLVLQHWRSACVVVPHSLWRTCSADQRRSILLHELTHIQRRDAWRQVAVRLLILPQWFNPVAWWAARQFETANEELCDEVACRSDASLAVTYANALLTLCEGMQQRSVASMAFNGGSLPDRIRRILNPELRKESPMSKVLISSLLIALIGVASIRIYAEEPTPKKSTDSAPPAESASLVTNGSFEELAQTRDPQSWFATRVGRYAGHFILASTSQSAHTGERSAAITIADSHPEVPVAYNWMTDIRDCKSGSQYELSAWVKAENVRKPAVLVAQFLGDNGKKMLGGATTEKSNPVSGTCDWKKVTIRFVVPEGTDVLRIRAALTAKDNVGARAWFDDIALVQVN